MSIFQLESQAMFDYKIIPVMKDVKKNFSIQIYHYWMPDQFRHDKWSY